MPKTCLLLMCLPWSGGSSAHFSAHPWLLMAWTIFWFPILYGLLPLGARLCLIVGFSSFSLLFYSFRSLTTIPAVSLCHSYCDVIWPQLVGALWACCLFFSQWLNMVIKFILILFWAFFITLLIGSFVPFISSWTSLAHLLSLGILGHFF